MRTYTTLILLIFGLIFVTGCENEKSRELEELEALEAAIEAGNPTDEQIEALTGKYMEVSGEISG